MRHNPELFERAYQRLQLVGAPDREGEDPDRPETVQAMQIVLHLPKGEQPDRRSLLEAAARAVVATCLDDRAGSDSAFSEALTSWYGARIRKVARRARNIHWERVQALPGVTVDADGAQARAFAPSAVRGTHPLLAKLQISGADLPLSEQREPSKDCPLIVVDAGLEMSVGKAAAQVGHASMLLAAHLPLSQARAWADQGFPLQILEVPHAEFERWPNHPAAVIVQDAGYTEVAPGSRTVAAVPGPCLST